MTDYELQLNAVALRRAMLTFGFVSSLLFLCSCATRTQTSAILSPSQLPAEIKLSSDAGHGGQLIVTLRLESGEELPVLLDTGAPFTLLDKSLESKLGKRRGTMPMTLAGQPTQQGGVYDSPGLYLGNTSLVTGPIVGTYDFKQPLKGILGMDCLKHYCIQLDFKSRQLRFLNSSQLNPAELGQKFPLTFENNCPLIDQRNLVGESARLLLVDTGCDIDGLVDRARNNFGGAYLLQCNWAGRAYTNLIVAAVERFNAIGLGFLARHLVTFDFPGKTMYLKQTVVGPLGDHGDLATASPGRSAFIFLAALKASRQLPGWVTREEEKIFFEKKINHGDNTVTYTLWVSDDSARYHYQVNRTSPSDTWKLQRAWRLDQDTGQLAEYSVP